MRASLLRALAAIAAGALMVNYREQMATWLTMSIGVLFFVSGIISIVSYFVSKKKAESESLIVINEDGTKASVPSHRPTLPIVGIGCAVLGSILALMPNTFITYMVYVLSAILILGAIGQYVSLISMSGAVRQFERQTGIKVQRQTGIIYWIAPSLLLIFAVAAMLYPEGIASAPFLFIGIAMIFYGIAEFASALKFYGIRKCLTAPEPQKIETETEETTETNQ